MRWLSVVGVFVAFLFSSSEPVSAQPDDGTLTLSELERLVRTLPEADQFEIGVVGSHVSWPDQGGDFEHLSGSAPGFTPEFIDIRSIVAVRLGPGWDPLFRPTDDVAGPWSLGQGFVDTGDGVLQTYAGESTVRDGSQYRLGAYFFGMQLAETPPAAVLGRCEFVFWIHDTRNTASWEPALPLDPAAGTNLAFGIGLNPEREGGTFALELGDPSGVFEPTFEFDVRGFVSDGFVGVLVPSFAAAEFDAVNASTFCSEVGFAFEAEASGSDQLGLVDVAPEDLGEYTASVAPASTSTLPPPDAGPADVTTTSARAGDDAGGEPWGLILIGFASLVLAILVGTRRNRSRR